MVTCTYWGGCSNGSAELLVFVPSLKSDTSSAVGDFRQFPIVTKRHFDVGFYVPVKWAKILSLNHQNIKLCSALLTSAGIYWT